ADDFSKKLRKQSCLGNCKCLYGNWRNCGRFACIHEKRKQEKSKYDLCFCCTIFSFRRFNNGCWQECIFLVICCSCCKFTTSIHYGGTKFDTVQKKYPTIFKGGYLL